ncbi:MAG: hypothetical protein WB539_09100, partial [Planktothrix agardhii]
RWYDLDPHIGLQETNHRFIKRLSKVEEYCGRPLSEYSLEEFRRPLVTSKSYPSPEIKSNF